MATGSVKVQGLRELRREFKRIDKDADKEVRDGLREAAQPVREEAANIFARYDARSAAGYRVSVRQRGVAVEQSRRRTTGQHPEFGALQMRRALIPALERREDKVVEGVERVMDMLSRRSGF